MTPLLDRVAIWAGTKPDAAAYTFVDYLADPGGPTVVCTWGEVHRRSIRLAQRLRRVVAPGDRVAVLAPSGLDYVLAMYASWYAGAIAVPLFAPGLPGHTERLAATYADCDPAGVVTVAAHAADVHDFVAGRAAVLVADADDEPDTGWRPGSVGRDDVAYLQYSSGSTRAPAGVEITHGNLTANVTQLCETLTGNRPHFTGVNWLPLFHDMGLLASVAVPMRAGTDAVLFDPAAFLMQPVRWLRLLSGRPDAYTAAPNFAYDYCLRRLEEGDLDGLDLSGVFLWLNGAEPVRAATLDRFTTQLAPAGLAPRAMCPAYGLAEATVYVAGHGIDHPPRKVAFDRDRLAAGRAVRATADSDRSVLVSCGPPAGQRVAVVDPESGSTLPDGRVGEIWVNGPNVTRRYWRRDDPGLFGDLGGYRWLRTGDLGTLVGGELYVTGRLKDLLIVAGRNHYPQDVEETVREAAPALGRTAAFAVLIDGEERAVVVAERSRSRLDVEWQPTEIVRAVRQAVWRRHDLALHDLVLAEPGAVPRTTSGKVSRTGCRARYLAGTWQRAASDA
ncbi:fatty acyl-AMP ligase [Paractinoplanes rishiriensis]|uniref:Acyl-CoA synthetase n=1 Tax=Paractinoplanes rishiriensis TaxID=1050105 RepID=A0A919K6Q8_9ACTN|nr:fatty acyl-AMP ligase [Actinoplanes rishiriensis]GIE97631.1 acyl-CoA synthetase [Actinoplanes rishiriensis]